MFAFFLGSGDAACRAIIYVVWDSIGDTGYIIISLDDDSSKAINLSMAEQTFGDIELADLKLKIYKYALNWEQLQRFFVVLESWNSATPSEKGA